MFWGLTLKANKRYSQTLKKSFHLSNAALDIHSCTDNEPVQVVITHDGHDYVLCNLRKNKVEQVAFDLTFREGEQIAFTSQGNGNVHLSGYLLLQEDYLYESSDEENEADEVVDNQATKKENKKKTGKGMKKSSLVAAIEEANDDEDEEDSDFQVEDEIESDEDEEVDEEGDDDDDEDESDDDDDEEEEEVVQEPKPKQMKLDNKAKQNGLENGDITGKEGTKKDKKKNKQKQQQNQQKQQPQQQKQQQQDKSPKGGEKTLQGGVKVEDIQVGTGPEAKPGKKVQVYYEGRLKQNNKVFDSAKEGKAFKFGLGKGEVIKGWDIGVAGMKVGGKRKIVCPPHMAYGAKGHPPVIPPNSTLVFEVELKGVN